MVNKQAYNEPKLKIKFVGIQVIVGCDSNAKNCWEAIALLFQEFVEDRRYRLQYDFIKLKISDVLLINIWVEKKTITTDLFVYIA